jgi:dihydropteroate synthase
VEALLRIADALGVERAPGLVAPHAQEVAAIDGRYAVIHAAPMFRYKQWTATGWRALAKACAARGLGVVVSHTGGAAPRTDPFRVAYGADLDGVVDDVVATLSAGAARAARLGLDAASVLLDPTHDFGKNTWHSLHLLRRTPALVALGHPVLMALSRKDFVGETLGLPVDDRLEGTLAATAVAAWLGARVFRTHDVVATRRVLDMVASMRGERPPASAVRGLV